MGYAGVNEVAHAREDAAGGYGDDGGVLRGHEGGQRGDVCRGE